MKKKTGVTKSKSGIVCTDIVSIIEACGSNGVSRISFDGVEIEFNVPSQADVIESTNPVLNVNTTIDPATAVEYNEEDDEPTEDEIGLAIDELKFTDPELWDDMARSGEV